MKKSSQGIEQRTRGRDASIVLTNSDHGNLSGGTALTGGNNTIFGGTGNSDYWLSNGNNWLDAGGGNDAIQAGVGTYTVFSGKGKDTLVAREILFERIRCDASNDLEWRMVA